MLLNRFAGDVVDLGIIRAGEFKKVKAVSNPRVHLMSKGKTNRYVWQANEEEALLNILDELVASGQLCDAGTFKVGAMKLRLKKDYSIVVDMLNQSGFAWNDEKKCVEVDSDEILVMPKEINPIRYSNCQKKI
ncbi:unnamed protein product [Prunus armeniaca]|uniref:Myb/SANT-like domain-containing protein n=1 Tax=Prunus armeniaca TaxID=36596 RepID=A0A6J5VTZ7_PRUAR|nr:unnamed protein product [Prunus armeniaca]